MANKLKLPEISKDTKILSFDLETNGLHGKAFAVGAVVIDSGGKIYDQFQARCEVSGKIDEWVELNVLPVIEDMKISYSSYEEMREAFWHWFVKAKEESDYVLVDNGYPVEYRFLLECQEADLETRYWDHPFPIIDLTSLMLGVGKDAIKNKRGFVKEFLDKFTNKQHHPMQDATVAALAAFKALRLSNQVK